MHVKTNFNSLTSSHMRLGGNWDALESSTGGWKPLSCVAWRTLVGQESCLHLCMSHWRVIDSLKTIAMHSSPLLWLQVKSANGPLNTPTGELFMHHQQACVEGLLTYWPRIWCVWAGLAREYDPCTYSRCSRGYWARQLWNGGQSRTDKFHQWSCWAVRSASRDEGGNYSMSALINYS